MHPLVLSLFDTPSAAAHAALQLRRIGISQERVSIVARNHDEEGALARYAGASPGSELEDSRPAGRLGELSAHFLAAVAIAMPGIGPLVADGPLAAGLGEAAGHVAGGIERSLERAGLPRDQAAAWTARIEAGAVLVAAHVDPHAARAAEECLLQSGASEMSQGTWADPGDH